MQESNDFESIEATRPSCFWEAAITGVRKSSRERILAAAAELACEIGPGHLSLDAVAQRAGVSKGGLLYNFSSKAKLLEALVEKHLDDFNVALTGTEARRRSEKNSVLAACIELFATEREQCQPPPLGVLAAMVENPELLAPIRRFKRNLLDRMKANAANEDDALLVYLALEGMRSLRLFDADILSLAEQDAALRSLTEVLSGRS